MVEGTRATQSAKFALMSDAAALYFSGVVYDPTLMMNRHDPQTDPTRTTPAPGDLRLLLTRQQRKPVAVFFRPKVKGLTGQPLVLTSPTGQTG
jgi:hypothetical protein